MSETFTRWTFGNELVPDERSPNYKQEMHDWNACQICDEFTVTGDRVYEWIPEESKSVRMCSPCWHEWRNGRLNMDRLLDNALIVVALLNERKDND